MLALGLLVALCLPLSALESEAPRFLRAPSAMPPALGRQLNLPDTTIPTDFSKTNPVPELDLELSQTLETERPQVPSTPLQPAMEPAAAMRQRKVEPLLQDPFDRPQAQETPVRQDGDAANAPPQLAPSAPAAGNPPPQPPAPRPAKSDFGKRAMTASLLIPALVGLIHAGGAAFTVLALLISAISLLEFSSLMKTGGRPVSRAAVFAGGMALSVSLIVGWPLAAALAALAGGAALIELRAKQHSLERAATTVFGAALFGLLPAYLALLRSISPHGAALTLTLFLAAWSCDTMAYLIGRRFGSHKIAPTISPKKTWEGAIAGFLAAVALSAGLALLFPSWLPIGAAIKIGFVMGTLGQLGGYVNSMIKRANGAKDSGKLLPGHGGVIDRFDAFILSAAVLYYLL
jgi:phosphatidate cytidylyltransferase